MISKRQFILFSIAGMAGLFASFMAISRKRVKSFLISLENLVTPKKQLNQTEENVFLSQNGTPQENVFKVIEMMGGIEQFIGKKDIVILKPNAQWWNQGRTNLAAMKGFIDLVLNIPDFSGEIIIGENHHFMDDSLSEKDKDNVRGWVHISEINGDIEGVQHNLNSLVGIYQKRGIKNVTKAHWRDGGPKASIWGNGQNGGTVDSPAQGDGYVWTNSDYILNGLWGLKQWKVKMTYPVFTSSYSGITVDFRNGAYRRDGRGGGAYVEDRAVKLINFSVLNDHGSDTGITAAVKNYMGITDLSCGWWGLNPKGYVNVHECGAGFYDYAKSGPLAYFMKTIRKADLNIVTAEWVGWGSRTDPAKATHMRTVLAGTDPVSVDYVGARHLVFPLSKNTKHHDPDASGSSIKRFLELAQRTLGEGACEEQYITLRQYDFQESDQQAKA